MSIICVAINNEEPTEPCKITNTILSQQDFLIQIDDKYKERHDFDIDKLHCNNSFKTTRSFPRKMLQIKTGNMDKKSDTVECFSNSNTFANTASESMPQILLYHFQARDHIKYLRVNCKFTRTFYFLYSVTKVAGVGPYTENSYSRRISLR